MPWNYQFAQNQEYAANFQAVVKQPGLKILRCRSSRLLSAVCGVTIPIGQRLGISRTRIKNVFIWQFTGRYQIREYLSTQPET
jgi:hypothetical protein